MSRTQLRPVPTTPASLTIEDLYRLHRRRLLGLAMKLVDDVASAEDVVQDAFAALHRNWGGLRDRSAAAAYLSAAVVNGSRSALRRRKRAREYMPPHEVPARSAESLALMTTDRQAVMDALAQLAPRQREVLVLRYYGGMTEAEIAAATRISAGAVKSTASRALDRLERLMAEYRSQHLSQPA